MPPITRQQFRENALPVELAINGAPAMMVVKEFKTGSLGWNCSGKVNVKIGDALVSAQVSFNLIIVDSGNLPQE
jgi:hypothetical protein